jgi:hypothetical protein
MWGRRLEDGVSPWEFAAIVGIVTFLCGTCLVQGHVALLLSVISGSADGDVMGRSSANPDWTPGWRYWSFCAGSAVAMFLIAVVLARRTYQAGLARARQRTPESSQPPPVWQFTLKSLLLLQLYVAGGLGLIAWPGRAFAPSVLGVLGSMVGYGITLASARRRIFDVVVGYMIGAMIGAAAAMRLFDLPTMQEGTLCEGTRRLIIMMVIAALPIVAVVAAWKLHLRPRLNKENADGTAEHG